MILKGGYSGEPWAHLGPPNVTRVPIDKEKIRRSGYMQTTHTASRMLFPQQ